MTTLTGFKPTGPLQLGNYLGAIRPMIDAQQGGDRGGHDSDASIALIVDLHALTVDHDPTHLRGLTLEYAATLLAAGIDPARTLLYVQSHVPAHLELHYLLECATGYGEAHRMIQFREKRTGDHTRLSLLTYPVLMAADILLHAAERVPVGDDQSQHLELTRTIATRCNTRYGAGFTVPRMVRPDLAARIKDLANPTAKMEKTNPSQAGVLRLLDPPDVVRRKVLRAVTDDIGEVRHDPERQPGVANLVEILAACRRADPAATAAELTTYQQLKTAVIDEVVGLLRPLQHRYELLRADPHELCRILADGADQARERTAPVLRRAYEALGLRLHGLGA
jgi:tryptophanyl-tRNA synthetase